MEINPIDLKKVDTRAANVYEAIIVSSKEARKINDENKIEFNTIVNSMTAGMEDDFDEKENPDLLRLSLEFEKRAKPHMIAINKLLEGEIEYRYKEEKSE